MVLGRENEHEFLLKYLSLSSLPGCIYLCGPPQSGKSLLLSSVLSECRDHLVTASVSAHPGAIHAR